MGNEKVCVKFPESPTVTAQDVMGNAINAIMTRTVLDTLLALKATKW